MRTGDEKDGERVMVMPKAAMKTTFTPMRQQYEAADGSATSLA